MLIAVTYGATVITYDTKGYRETVVETSYVVRIGDLENIVCIITGHEVN